MSEEYSNSSSIFLAEDFGTPLPLHSNLTEPVLPIDPPLESENAWSSEEKKESIPAVVNDQDLDLTEEAEAFAKDSIPSPPTNLSGPSVKEPEAEAPASDAEAKEVPETMKEYSTIEEDATHVEEFKSESDAALVEDGESSALQISAASVESIETPSREVETVSTPEPERAIKNSTEDSVPESTSPSKSPDEDRAKLFKDNIDSSAPETDTDIDADGEDILGTLKPAVPIAVSSWTTKKRPPQHAEIPVEILTTAAMDQPKARSSPANPSPTRSFSRIPAIPEPKKIDMSAIEAFNDEEEEDVFAQPEPELPVASPPEVAGNADSYSELPQELVSMAERCV